MVDNDRVNGVHVQGPSRETWNFKGVVYSSFYGVMVKGFHFGDPKQIVVNAFF